MAVVEQTATARWRAGGRTQPRLRGWMHLCTVPLAMVGTVLLVRAAPTGTARVAALVYGVSVCALFTVSALYHRLRWYEVAHSRMRRLDHGTIFVMIGGTFTPLCLLASGGMAAIVVLAIVWLTAAAGFVLCVTGIDERHPAAPTVCYAALAVIGLIALPALLVQLDGWQSVLVVAATALYGLGAACLARRRPDPRPATFGYHEIWHAVVVLASACLYLVVLSLVRRG